MQLNKAFGLFKEIALIVLTLTGMYLFSILASYTPADPAWSSTALVGDVGNIGGLIGAYVSDYLISALGYTAFLLPLYLVLLGIRLYRKDTPNAKKIALVVLNMIGFCIALIALSAMLAHPWWGGATNPLAPMGLGGMVGVVTVSRFVFWLGQWGALLFSLLLFFTAVTGVMGMTWRQLLGTPSYMMFKVFGRVYGLVFRIGQAIEKLVGKFLAKYSRYRRMKSYQAQKTPVDIEINFDEPSGISKPTKQAPKATQMNLMLAPGRYQMPSAALLSTSSQTVKAYSKETLEKISKQLELKLADFGFTSTVMSVQPGPVITRFELDLASGIKVSQIVSITKDLARALAVISVRVVEVIPNKTFIGIEIPNQHRALVGFKDVVLSQPFVKSKYTLPLALGQDIAGTVQVADLSKMPHLLVAGTTGSGKSVGVNTMIVSLLYCLSPDQVRFIMIDPKMLELSIYDGIPHLLSPVVTNMQKAANVLKWCVAEMERRYQLLASQNVRNIEGFNQRVQKAIQTGKPLIDPTDQNEGTQKTLTPLPFIVVVIDEFADLIMVVGKPVEELVARLAQKARAAGIHLIIATQRPSVNVITGLIKANIPTRIAFQVSSKIDSRTILDQMGAENLLGKGDMLYLPPGSGLAERIHGAFLTDDEVFNIVKFLKKQPPCDYQVEAIEEFSEAQAEQESGLDDEPLYDQAVNIVKDTGRASISSLQRQLKVGYNRAARMIDQMEKQGIVSAMDGRGNREVL